MFDLQQLTALAANTPTSAVSLSPMSVQIILAAAAFAEDMENWQGAGYELTSAEIDEIRAAVALMQSEVIG